MLYNEIQKLSINDLIIEIGKTIEADIKTKHLKKSDVAKRAGINYMSLYRLLNGENYSIDTLLKVLKVLEKFDAIDCLVTQIPVNPIDLYSKFKKRKIAKGSNAQIMGRKRAKGSNAQIIGRKIAKGSNARIIKRKRATGNNTQIISVNDINSSFEEEIEWNV